MNLNKLRIHLKNNKYTNLFYNLLKYCYYHLYIYSHKNIYKNVRKELSRIQIDSIMGTVYQLIYSDKSLGRFGDGELSWILNKNTGINEFEKPSKSLSYELLKVLNSNNNKFMVGLPDSFKSLDNLKEFPREYWEKFIIKEMPTIIKRLNFNKKFYDSMVTRPYMDFNNKRNAGLIFYLMKYIWKNKRVLIIEGIKSRIGVGDNLLNDAKDVVRIECPATNAFESYNNILKVAVNFLKSHSDFITLISLGPTATILAYDLCNKGFRSIDIGNIDIEYNWYKLGVNQKIDLPYHYVNEAIGGQTVKPINSSKYTNEIVNVVK